MRPTTHPVSAPTTRPTRGDRGQATALVGALLTLAVLTLVALGPLGRELARRTQARTAADAAALAGAAEGEPEAERVAASNGGDLLEYRPTDDGTVVVRVRVGDVDAWASAQGRRRALPRDLPRFPGVAGLDADPGTGAGAGGTGERAGLAPAMLAALGRADRMLGHPVPIVSGLRTRAQQQALYDRRRTNRYPVARPGTSDHERGLAVDVPRGSVGEVLGVAEAVGLCQPLPQADPVHFVVCGA